jgi:hypothetical protein
MPVTGTEPLNAAANFQGGLKGGGLQSLRDDSLLSTDTESQPGNTACAELSAASVPARSKSAGLTLDSPPAKCGGARCGLSTCRECRARAAGLAKRKYVWTPELTERLRDAYKNPKKPALTAALKLLSARARWPRAVLTGEAHRIGLAERRAARERKWTESEIEHLRWALGTASAQVIARKLGQSRISVESKIAAMKISAQVGDGYGVSDIAQVMGVSQSKVSGWLRRGLMGRVREAEGQLTEQFKRLAMKNVQAYMVEVATRSGFRQGMTPIDTSRVASLMGLRSAGRG